MQFHEKRRQQFLGEQHFLLAQKSCDEGVQNIGKIIEEAVQEGDLSYVQSSASMRGFLQFNRLILHYTAGAPIESLRSELEEVVAAYERYGNHLWKYTGDRNEVVFKFYSLDEYCQLMQLVGLCFLLHRRDLLPRLAALQDGEERANVGSDWLLEEFLSYAPMDRQETEHVCATRPYEPLIDAMSSADNDAAIKDLNLFLKHWYKDLAGTGWHDSHKGDGSGYYGYWSFEASAAVLLLGIEDDSSLHKYLYYPKDLIAWSRTNTQLSEAQEGKLTRLRSVAGQTCPKEGFWFTPAKADSRQKFAQGQVMPTVGGDYGTTIWQWDEAQG